MKKIPLILALGVVLSLVLAACGSAEVATPQVVQVEVTRVVTEEVVVEKEVPVVVEKEVAVEKEVVVEVEKEVVREVEKRVIQTVVVEKQVIKEIEVVKEIVKEVLVPASGPYGGDLKVIAQSSIKTLDPDFGGAYVTRAVAVHLWEFLFSMDENYIPQPLMVGDWSLSSDGMTYSFTLRDDLMFHDGTKVDAQDAIASIEKWITKAPAAKLLSGFMAENGLKATDDKTFTLSLAQPYGAVTYSFALMHQSPTIHKKDIAALSSFEDMGEENYIGSGPYKLKNWEVGNKVVIERNVAYVPRNEPGRHFAGAQISYLDTVEWLEITSEETKMAGLKTGEWDVVDGAALDFYKDMLAHPDIDVAVYKPGHQSYLNFNHEGTWTSDQTFRQAILAAVDNVAMMSALGEPDLWQLCPALFYCGTPLESNAGSELYNQSNPTRAMELLAQTGYDGTPIKILNPTDYATISPLGPVLKPTLEAIGINIDMPALDWATASSTAYNTNSWHIRTSWTVHWGDSNPITNAGIAGTRFDKYNNEDMKRLQVEYATAITFEEQYRIAEEIQRIHYEDVMWINLGQFFSIHPHRNWVKNLKPVKSYPHYMNVWLEK